MAIAEAPRAAGGGGHLRDDQVDEMFELVAGHHKAISYQLSAIGYHINPFVRSVRLRSLRKIGRKAGVRAC
jgi:hypothetical protein